jgi:5-methylcytosine-specific restriction endonuclease McrA
MQRAGAAGYKGPHFTGQEWLALVEACGRRCLRCGSLENLTVDHVIPLGRGGPNTIENVQPLCAECDNAKGCEVLDYRTTA